MPRPPGAVKTARRLRAGHAMKNFIAIIERDSETRLYVGCVPGIHDAHRPGATLVELRVNLQEVAELLCDGDGSSGLEDGDV